MHESANGDLGAYRLFRRERLGSVRSRDLPIYQRPNAGRLDFDPPDLPHCDRGHAPTYHPLGESRREHRYVCTRRADGGNVAKTTRPHRLIRRHG
jgi:hypothetical protein